MNLTLKVWRQKNAQAKGKLVPYSINAISPDMSFLEMMDVLNQQLILQGEDPVAMDNDCREGICGMCSLFINGRAHGPQQEATVCQLHMRSFGDGATIVVEPWRAKAFPVVKDLVVDRSAFDRIIQAGGFVSVKTAVWRLAKTLRPCFLSAPKSPNWCCFPRGPPNAKGACAIWCA